MAVKVQKKERNHTRREPLDIYVYRRITKLRMAEFSPNENYSRLIFLTSMLKKIVCC